MKFYETHFEEYINENNRINLHPKLDKIYERFPKSIVDLKNVIFFGASGTGKYTQMLKFIKKYSPTELKYEKKISLTYQTRLHGLCFVHILRRILVSKKTTQLRSSTSEFKNYFYSNLFK
jgi:hypothetical protein